MKILVMSLLRLGDFLMVAPILAGLREKYPSAKIDVWVHDSVARGMRDMIPLVNQWWTLNRDEMQMGLGESDIPMLTSLDILREQCELISGERYDLVINLTQTRFSGLLMGYIHAKAKMGLTIDGALRAHFLSPWFRYLNDRAEGRVDDIFHHTDIFRFGSDVGTLKPEWPFRETKTGRQEIAEFLKKERPRVVIQALTSDSKKNWGIERWRECLRALNRENSETEIVLLGAPNEESTLQRIISDDLKNTVRLAILSMEGAFALLRRSDLLMTGDTSIKHLACGTDIKILELSIGSSDYLRTGAYRDGAVIVQGNVPCAPCPHSSKCDKTSHLCAEAMNPHDVARLAVAMLREEAIPAVAGARVLKTFFSNNGYFIAKDIFAENGQPLVEAMLKKSTWKFLLESQDSDALPTIGSEAFEMGEVVEAEGFALKGILNHLDFLESKKNQSEAAREIPSQAESGLVDITSIRAQQNKLEWQRREEDIRTRLVRAVRSSLREKVE